MKEEEINKMAEKCHRIAKEVSEKILDEIQKRCKNESNFVCSAVVLEAAYTTLEVLCLSTIAESPDKVNEEHKKIAYNEARRLFVNFTLAH